METKLKRKGAPVVSIHPAAHSPVRFAALLFLARNGGRAAAGKIWPAIGLASCAALASHRRKLVGAGLITTDGAGYELTPQGRNALAAIAREINRAIKTPTEVKTS